MAQLEIITQGEGYKVRFYGNYATTADAQDRVRELVDAENVILSVTFDSVAWEHYDYGAQWGPPVNNSGWRNCPFCERLHPVHSEC